MRLVALPPCLAAAFLNAFFEPARLPEVFTAVTFFAAGLLAGLATVLAAFLAVVLVAVLAGALIFAGDFALDADLGLACALTGDFEVVLVGNFARAVLAGDLVLVDTYFDLSFDLLLLSIGATGLVAFFCFDADLASLIGNGFTTCLVCERPRVVG